MFLTSNWLSLAFAGRRRLMKAIFIADPKPGVDYPFSLTQAKRWRYMCSACQFLTDDIGAVQQHLYTKHPEKRERKPCKLKENDKLRKPDARERKDIRDAIAEAKQRKFIL